VQSPDTARLTSMHFYAWERGLKTGVYYLRSRAAVDAIKFTVDHAAVLQARASQNDKRNSSLSASSSTDALSTSSSSSLPEPGVGPASDDRSSYDVQAFRLMKQRARAAADDGEGCLMCSS
jgi:ribonucleoside-diphosphate reductase alpha chain